MPNPRILSSGGIAILGVDRGFLLYRLKHLCLMSTIHDIQLYNFICSMIIHFVFFSSLDFFRTKGHVCPS